MKNLLISTWRLIQFIFDGKLERIYTFIPLVYAVLDEALELANDKFENKIRETDFYYLVTNIVLIVSDKQISAEELINISGYIVDNFSYLSFLKKRSVEVDDSVKEKAKQILEIK